MFKIKIKKKHVWGLIIIGIIAVSVMSKAPIYVERPKLPADPAEEPKPAPKPLPKPVAYLFEPSIGPLHNCHNQSPWIVMN